MSLHFKLQRADPSLATITHLMESDQLYKRKPNKKDSADIKSLLRIKKSLVLTKGILFRKSFTGQYFFKEDHMAISHSQIS